MFAELHVESLIPIFLQRERSCFVPNLRSIEDSSMFIGIYSIGENEKHSQKNAKSEMEDKKSHGGCENLLTQIPK